MTIITSKEGRRWMSICSTSMVIDTGRSKVLDALSCYLRLVWSIMIQNWIFKSPAIDQNCTPSPPPPWIRHWVVEANEYRVPTSHFVYRQLKKKTQRGRGGGGGGGRALIGRPYYKNACFIRSQNDAYFTPRYTILLSLLSVIFNWKPNFILDQFFRSAILSNG